MKKNENPNIYCPESQHGNQPLQSCGFFFWRGCLEIEEGHLLSSEVILEVVLVDNRLWKPSILVRKGLLPLAR